MTIPGSNILASAFTAIAQDVVQYKIYLNTTLNAIGTPVPNYEDPIAVRGSFQPIERSLYSQQGLDLAKNFVNFYAKMNMQGVERAKSGDQFSYAGKTYQIESADNWFNVDGWTEILASEFTG